MRPNNANRANAQSQFIEQSWEQKAELAFRAHTALLKAQAADVSLIGNPYFDQLRLESYERFLSAWGKVQ